jgi:hypothetical protein
MGKVLLGKPGGGSVDMGMLTKGRGIKSAYVLEVSWLLGLAWSNCPFVGRFWLAP